MLCNVVQIAAVFEFAGALVLGRVVTNTIAGGIADINAFVRTPEIYAYGMVCALFVGGIFQLIASFLELNVSATHSISESWCLSSCNKEMRLRDKCCLISTTCKQRKRPLSKQSLQYNPKPS